MSSLPPSPGVRPSQAGDGLRLALVAAVGAWIGDSIIGARWGAAAGAAGAVLLVTTERGARLLAQARELVPELEARAAGQPWGGNVVKPPASVWNNPRDFHPGFIVDADAGSSATPSEV